MMIPTSRDTPTTGDPNTDTRPALGRTNPAITHNKLDFPHPDGPTNDTNSPARTANDTSRTAVNTPPPGPPNRCDTPTNSTAQPATADPPTTSTGRSSPLTLDIAHGLRHPTCRATFHQPEAAVDDDCHHGHHDESRVHRVHVEQR